MASTVRERQEVQEKAEEGKEASSSKSDWTEWNSEQACGRMLEEGPSHVNALRKGIG